MGRLRNTIIESGVINICVILYVPKDKNVYRKTLKECHNSNPNGSGFMFAHKDKLHVMKGFNGFRHFYKTYRKYERLFPESDFVIHMRIATSGLLNEVNCHPFYVHNKLAFAHNGIFSGLGNKTFSDTYELNETVFKKFPANFLEIAEIRDLVDKYVERGYSKVVFMDNKGKVLIMNEKAGEWDNGVWFSNKTHSYYTSCYGGYGYGRNDWRKGYGNDVDGTTSSSLAIMNDTPISENGSMKANKFSLSDDYYCTQCNSRFNSIDVMDTQGYIWCPLCGDVLDVSMSYQEYGANGNCI